MVLLLLRSVLKGSTETQPGSQRFIANTHKGLGYRSWAGFGCGKQGSAADFEPLSH